MDWIVDYWWALIFIIPLALFLLFRRRLRNPSLDWGALASSLRFGSVFEQVELEEEDLDGADRGIQFEDGFGAVIYRRSDRYGVRVEMLDIIPAKRIGFIVRFHDEKLTSLIYMDGRVEENLQFNPQQQMILLELLRRVQKYADQKQ